MNLLLGLLQLPRSIKRIVSVAIDVSVLLFALMMAYGLEFGPRIPPAWGLWLLLYLVIALTSTLVFIKLGLYRAVVRYVSTRALLQVLVGVLFSTLILVLGLFVLNLRLPANAIINFSLISLLLIGGARVAMRELYQRLVTRRKEAVLIYGAGSAGRQLAQALFNGEQFHPIAFIDDDATLQRSTLLGLAVIDPSQVEAVISKSQISRILLALPSSSRNVRRQILESLQGFNVKIQTIPGMADMVNGEMGIDELRDVNIEDLLGRDPVEPDPVLMQKHIRGKVVLITGAGGSIGSELCRQIVYLKPTKLVLYDISEYNLYAIDAELRELCVRFGQKVEIFPIIGTVQRRNRIERVMRSFQVNTVFHAAAYKHVPLVEFNMVEGVRNNVFGTWHTAEAALAAGVDQFVLISTDKAVRPTNVMGATKRIAELVLQGMAQRDISMQICMVRFGNVLGSSGSVVPLFKRQIEQGGPITVTHPDITRYFMTIPEAAQLVIQASTMGNSGAVFVLDMGEPVKIIDMAKKMIRLSGLELRTEEHPVGDIDIVYTGLRPGEKLYEELLIGDNVEKCDHPRVMRANETCLPWPEIATLLDTLDGHCNTFAIEALRDTILAAPAGYAPTDKGINDLLWQHSDKRG